ncbi:hypothetical protein RhoFasGS6_05070 [Rhodococcus fascians]|nr:hypothetical protein [Rhodococcus fascians]
MEEDRMMTSGSMSGSSVRDCGRRPTSSTATTFPSRRALSIAASVRAGLSTSAASVTTTMSRRNCSSVASSSAASESTSIETSIGSRTALSSRATPHARTSSSRLASMARAARFSASAEASGPSFGPRSCTSIAASAPLSSRQTGAKYGCTVNSPVSVSTVEPASASANVTPQFDTKKPPPSRRGCYLFQTSSGRLFSLTPA